MPKVDNFQGEEQTMGDLSYEYDVTATIVTYKTDLAELARAVSE